MGRQRKYRKGKERYLYTKGRYAVVKSSNERGDVYYTIINRRTWKHTHVDTLDHAKWVCLCAAKTHIPDSIPEYIKRNVLRIVG